MRVTQPDRFDPARAARRTLPSRTEPGVPELDPVRPGHTPWDEGSTVLDRHAEDFDRTEPWKRRRPPARRDNKVTGVRLPEEQAGTLFAAQPGGPGNPDATLFASAVSPQVGAEVYREREDSLKALANQGQERAERQKRWREIMGG